MTDLFGQQINNLGRLTSLSWLRDKLGPVERHVYRTDLIKVGVFDCPGDHPCFPVTEPVQNNLFVLATKPVWFRRNTPGFQYVGPGGVVLHPAGATIERLTAPPAQDLSYWFAIRPDVYAEIAATHGIERSLPKDAICPTPGVQLDITMLLRRIKLDTATTLDVDANVISLFDSICENWGVSTGSAKSSPIGPNARMRARCHADAAKSFVDANLAENFDINTVAGEIGVSPFHLCRLFKSFNGITLHEYRIRQRLAFVMHRLADQACHNLTELALDAGFSSHSHLTRMFKNRLGVAPSAVRSLAQTWASQCRTPALLPSG